MWWVESAFFGPAWYPTWWHAVDVADILRARRHPGVVVYSEADRHDDDDDGEDDE
jgi:hypothetical protein